MTPPNALRGGLSPRVRGNPAASSSKAARGGSIPACAGEPARCGARKADARVYPRVCGGTRRIAARSAKPRGLSPRVRGNPRRQRERIVAVGSIPACAGEPFRRRRGSCWPGVYPRVCGGTSTTGGLRSVMRGLSPRVRGNPFVRVIGSDTGRSIPACAGEPKRQAAGSVISRVYPRVCGGTQRRLRLLPDCLGLSPRVRGNHQSPRRHVHREGSIPACAGEP